MGSLYHCTASGLPLMALSGAWMAGGFNSYSPPYWRRIIEAKIDSKVVENWPDDGGYNHSR